MNMQYKSAQFEIKQAPGEDGVFEGYASVFNVVDDGLDVVRRGAFTNSLASGNKVRLLWQHDQSQPIGVWDELAEDERGLFVKGRLIAGVKKADEAMALLKAGALDSMSIGYRVIRASDEAGGRVRGLDEVELVEISLVTFPMLREALVTDVKAITTIREFERTMRDAGFSQTEAKAIAANGYKGLASRRDVDELEPEAKGQDVAPFLDQIRRLKGVLNV